MMPPCSALDHALEGAVVASTVRDQTG